MKLRLINLGLYFKIMEASNGKQNPLNEESISLYEEVLSKNFEIIENFLSRFHSIFTSKLHTQRRTIGTRGIPQKSGAEVGNRTPENVRNLCRK